MTVKELLEAATFQEIAPYLMKYLGHPPYDFYGSARELHSYREAYDRLLVAETDDASVGKDVSLEDLMDSPWRYQLPKTYNADFYKGQPLAKTAALALWNLTYYGTSDKTIKRRFENWFKRKAPINKYDEALRRLEASYFKHQIPREFRNFSNNQWYYRLANPKDKKRKRKYERYVNRKKLNRPKRMRKHRQDEREEWLKKMRAKQYIIDILTADGSSFAKGSLDFILSSHGSLEDFHAINPVKPFDYILESVRDYTDLPYKDYNRSIVFIEIPSTWDVSEYEKESFQKDMRQIIGYDNISFGQREYEGDELNVDVLLYRLN